jgi:hypothetical protein
MSSSVRHLVLLGLFLGSASPASARGAGGVTPLRFWVEGVAYRTVQDISQDLPESAPVETFDHFYVISQRFGGCGPVTSEHNTLDLADTAPGARGYHGGRWEAYPVLFGENCENYQVALERCSNGGDIKHISQLQCAIDAGLAALGPLIRRFECPVIPEPEGQAH